MSALGANTSTPLTMDSVTCRLCRHVLEFDASRPRPRRCPSCKAWLALRHTASSPRDTPHEPDMWAPVARSAPVSPEETLQEEPASEKGWRAISSASLFHRFDLPELSDFHTTPDPHVTTPDHADVHARRALEFDFKQPEVRQPPAKEVTPQLLRDELARREHIETSEDDAIEAWLDRVESEVHEIDVEPGDEAFSAIDAYFEAGATSFERDALHVGQVEQATLELDREPERFELQLGTQHIRALDREAVNALILSGLERDALIRCTGQERWRPIGEHETFAMLYVADDALREDKQETAAPGVEVDEPGDETLMLLDEGEEAGLFMTLPGMRSVEEETPSRTLIMFAAQEDETTEIAPLGRDGAASMETQDDVPVDEPAVRESSQEEAWDADEAIGRSVKPSAGAWRKVWLVAGVLVVFVLGSLVGGVVMQQGGSDDLLNPGAQSPSELLESMIMLPRERAMRHAVHGARTVVHLSHRQDFMAPARQLEVAHELVKEGDHEAAARVFGVLWRMPSLRTADLGLTYARSAQHAGQFKVAREVAIQTRALEDAGGVAEELAAIFNTSVREDAALHPEVLTLRKDVDVDVARALGGGKSISLKFEKGGETRYAFKPSQLDWAEGWRAEVAAYLWCEAIGCHFKVPRSLPVRISREDFEALYGRFTSSKQTAYAETFPEKLLWVKEPGPDGEEREYLYGVMKEWMPGFVDFPIEYEDIWGGWLDARGDATLMDRDLRDALSVLRVRQEGRYFDAVMGERKGATTRSVARGISDVLVFDYLTSNWDRYSGVETYYGVNNQFDEGEFLSLDNGAAFHILTQRKVEQRFEPVTRFSRTTIAAMRMADPQSINDILFPQPGQEARQRLAVFWTQRERLLTRVDELAQAHGRSNVLYFE